MTITGASQPDADAGKIGATPAIVGRRVRLGRFHGHVAFRYGAEWVVELDGIGVAAGRQAVKFVTATLEQMEFLDDS